ncbi:hypothetical protein Tcan_09478 [Toxocara canis]|uniref:BHLH domain-containing protein n=1 Tax=Toxocara canis TaxID=6265 RepID=A0A0B2VK66_TOXCA|nr:hypothetical protein Tcan_09478 [Toxocara canis]
MRSSPSPSSCYSSSSESDPSSIVRKGRITKASREKRERRETMAKLQKMVPYAREGDSQLQLLQHIMDYIYFLQKQLQEDVDNVENVAPITNITDLSRLFSQFSTDASRNAQRVLSS